MKRIITFFIVLGLGIFLLSGCKGSSSEGTTTPLELLNSNGSMFRANLAHTGVYEGRGVPSLHGPRWEFRTGDWVSSSPVITDGIVYFGSADGYLYALDAKSGKLKWRFKTEGEVYSSPAVADGTVYFGSADNYLYALE